MSKSNFQEYIEGMDKEQFNEFLKLSEETEEWGNRGKSYESNPFYIFSFLPFNLILISLFFFLIKNNSIMIEVMLNGPMIADIVLLSILVKYIMRDEFLIKFQEEDRDIKSSSKVAGSYAGLIYSLVIAFLICILKEIPSLLSIFYFITAGIYFIMLMINIRD